MIAEKEDIVGEKVGVNDALRQASRPFAFERCELAGEQTVQVALHLVGAMVAGGIKLLPAGDRKRILAAHREIRAGEMKPRQRLTQGGAMLRARTADPHALQKGDHRRRPPGKPAQGLAGAVLDRLRTGDAAARQMLHQRKKERQVALGHAPLVQRQNEIAAAGVDQKVRVLDALGDSLVREELADVVAGEEEGEVFRRDIGVDSH